MSRESAVINAIRSHGSKLALEAPDQSLTYDMLATTIAQAREYLKDSHVAALMMENSPAWIILDLACVEAGVPLLPLPAFFSEKQLSHALLDAGVDTVFTDHPARFNGSAERFFLAGIACYRIRLKALPNALPANTAKITYTSGTTDTPKGVCLSQQAMETVAHSLLSVIPTQEAARHVCLLPLAVLLENVAGVYTALLAGATICLPPVKHEPEALHKAITDYNATSCIFVPELLRMILATSAGLPSLRYAAVGGARVAPELLKAAWARGIPVYEGYGLSEACSVVAVNSPAHHKTGSVGKLLPHIALRIEKDGEIIIRRPLFSGYLGDATTPPEWFATGDIGYLDGEGFLHIEGRKKNIYITSYGRNVSPEWVESLLTAHPAIAQAVVYGEAKPSSTAVIVTRHPQAAAEAIRQVNHQLPDYARIGDYVLAHPFSISNQQLTGTGRPRREAIYQAYAHDIQTGGIAI